MEEDTLSLVERLGLDTAGRIFSYLDEPIDLARLATVSRSCRRIGKYFTFICSSLGVQPLTYGHIRAEMALIRSLFSFMTFAWQSVVIITRSQLIYVEIFILFYCNSVSG